MIAPAYVGTGPAIWDPGTQWAPSLTVTAADLPSGTTYDEHGNVTATVNLTGLPIPEPAPAEITLADVAAALRDPLANLTDSSASTTVRTAILNQRAALDALLAALETP